jgi:nicotinate dehydrogenase subunit A
MAASYTLRVNGQSHTVVADAETSLLYLLRNDLGLNGPKFGCGLGQCGACAVLMNGVETRSCIMPIAIATWAEIVTSEGLGTIDAPHPLQAAFVAEQAAQCGYCISGMIIAAAALLANNPRPTAGEIRAALDGHLCRCGTHLRIVRAIQRAADQEGRT